MIRLAVVEDEQKYIEQLTGYIADYQKEMNQDITVRLFRDGEDLVENYRAEYDIILLDIQLQFMDGMSTAQIVRQKDSQVVIMFITGMASYAVKGYEVDALDYILKPVNYFTFSQKLTRAIERIKKKETQFITIPVSDGLQKLDIGRVFYIESQGHTMTYHTKDGIFASKGRLEELEKNYGPFGFFRSNKGFLVNMYHVDSVKSGCCVINGDMLPISRRKKAEFIERLADIL